MIEFLLINDVDFELDVFQNLLTTQQVQRITIWNSIPESLKNDPMTFFMIVNRITRGLTFQNIEIDEMFVDLMCEIFQYLDKNVTIYFLSCAFPHRLMNQFIKKTWLSSFPLHRLVMYPTLYWHIHESDDTYFYKFKTHLSTSKVRNILILSSVRSVKRLGVNSFVQRLPQEIIKLVWFIL